MLNRDTAALVLVDVQGKLATLMHDSERVIENCRKLVQGTRRLSIPIFWNEQLPEKLGPTVPELREPLSGLSPLPKSSFSCWENPVFRETLQASGRRQLLLAGIEAHVCVYQTAQDLLAEGYEVHLMADAVSSRRAECLRIALDRMVAEGARLSCVEMALFELLQVAEGEIFREILRIIK
jgi:nicotinamidase-related amidase